MAGSSAKGLRRYFEAPNAAEALGAAKPIRKDTQPDKKAISGPYASRR